MRLLRILAIVFVLPNLAMATPPSLPEWQQQFFIDTWYRTAIDNMNRYGIPASITLAQAIVESGWGQGRVAIEANNFFCIKANNGWAGEVIRHMDDEQDSSVFRRYLTVEESFSDHSAFLRGNNRYRSLFELSPTDYRSWAQGLKSAGYATDSSYAERLITVIERHRLYVYDSALMAAPPRVIDSSQLPMEEEQSFDDEQAVEAQQAPAVEGFATHSEATVPVAEPTQSPQLKVPTYRIGNERHQAQPPASVQKPVTKMKLLMPKTSVNLQRR